ncbi:MBOAT family O-acyltransferase [Mucilaginibacter psychrotolerans]|uniref:MBOAT family protein n=1 Tax=Mucilaginibacter psychrotolerans TaxID=1524096 RepID=A0A4Y8SPM1_9SPHI|nr:MBOAT family O-acyltransferase [Mucilaginibacter psychrotolerans]TFF40868.1 MBOAT family protein [Mucilaginibacter psychrotolerans]
MLFNSLLFLLFFIMVTCGYYLVPGKFRWIWLLIASCYFYMYFKPVYILIILFTIVVDYVAGLCIESATGSKRKLFLIISLVANIGVLAFYKYFDFLAQNINLLSALAKGPQIPLLNIILPIGLSFHTFQAMSYTIEVYRGNQKAERHFGIYALYVLFYPQMVAGPIERPQHILPQLHLTHKFVKSTFIAGLFLIMVGVFKKVVIADRLGLYVEPVFSDPHRHTSLDLLFAIYFFAIQIYCDFSGYSDIAVGAAMTLGINLMRNFHMPYLAKNISEFWSKWHISLSSWFRDYVYIPLGGSRISFAVTCVNIMIVFIISGLWHGANWKYLVWGGIHGLLLITYQAIKKLKINLPKAGWLGWLVTFNLVSLAWVFFRANTITDAIYILRTVFSGPSYGYGASGVMQVSELYYCGCIIALLLAGEWYLNRSAEFSDNKKITAAMALGVACYFLGVFNDSQFIYFQF